MIVKQRKNKNPGHSKNAHKILIKYRKKRNGNVSRTKKTHKFLKFSDRIANINIDVIHRIGHRYEERTDQEVELFFRISLVEWKDKNCTQGWIEFYNEVKDVETLAQLILLRERVVASLLNHLERKDPLTIEALLEVVVALAKDLRQDFHPFYPDFVTRIIALLDLKDADVLEWSFKCLAYLFKFLWRCMVRNVGPILSSLLPLLSAERPEYINIFAADSFAFLARKVKDQSAFVLLILNHLEEQPEDVEGCGWLVFAWMSGVSEKLHSCAENVLSNMMQLLGNDAYPSDPLESLLSNTLSHLVREIAPGGLWNAFLKAIQGTFKQLIPGHTENIECFDVLGRVLKLINQFCSHHEAIHVTSPSALVELLWKVYGSSSQLPNNILSELASIVAVLLMSPTVSLPQDQTVKLITKILNVSPSFVILSFVKQVLSWSALETLILPDLLRIVGCGFIKGNDDGPEAQILAEIVQFKVPSLYKDHDEPNLVSYNLDFTSASRRDEFDPYKISSKFISILEITKETSAASLTSSMRERFCALEVLPHAKPNNEKKVLKTLQVHCNYLCTEIKCYLSALNGNSDQRNDSELSQLLLLLAASLEAIIHLNGQKKGLQSVLDLDLLLETLLAPARSNPFRLSALHSLNMYLSFVDFENLKDVDKVSLLIYESLKCNLSAPHHLIRELTCRVLCQLPLPPAVNSMFRLCLDAEIAEVSITEFRNKLRHFEKLSFEVSQADLVLYPEYRMAPLYFIFGSLYVNFKLVWQPLQSLISSYAMNMAATEFWPTFHEQLSLAMDQRDFLPDHGTAPNLEFDCSLLDDYYSTLNDVDDNPDHAHYRLLLWESCHSFPEVCEKHQRDISAMFLSFVKNEYYAENAEVATTWNIKKHDNSEVLENEDMLCQDQAEEQGSDNEELGESKEEVDALDIENDADASESHAAPQSDEKPTARLLTRTLLIKLQLFSKMRNPRGIHREPELNQVYHDFLSHTNSDIQKAALECLLTYKYKYLTPYSQNLFSLIDDKSFKSEMSRFGIDKESGVIQEEHRPQLIPIILKLLYSKMVAKTGMRTGGKAHSAKRRVLILRYIAGCHEDEMLMYLRMAFRFFEKYLQGDLSAMVDSIQSNIDLENVVPPRRLQSAVNLLSVVQEQFGGLMGNRLLSLNLRLLICVSATVDEILKQRKDIHTGFLKALRGLRISSTEVLTQFFARFESYPWTRCEIDSILQVFVHPFVDLLPVEGIGNPTVLMKLFKVWSQHPRYFVLFGACKPNALESNPISALMKLLLNSKTHSTVLNFIMEILENLLTLKDHRQMDENDMELDETYLEERAPPITVSHIVPLKDKEMAELHLSTEVNLGSKLIFPHIGSVLERFKIRLASKRGAGLNKRELLVLSNLSEFVRAPDTSAALADLLFPLLSKKVAVPHEDDEAMLKLMSTLVYLVRNVNDPHNYTRAIAPLFGCINGVAGRKMLVSLMDSVAEATAAVYRDREEEMKRIASIACRMNACDKRFVDQPDFNTRLDAFKEIGALLDEGKLSVDLGIIVIHHCFYVIRAEKDLSLQDYAAHCLRKVAPKLSLQYSENELAKICIIDSTILPLIRNAIANVACESLHSAAVLLLGEMARECSNLHPVFRDLHPLTNTADIEVDFFENLEHLQLHRKTRALLRICSVLKNVEKIADLRSLTHFLLPLASQYLCSEKYAGKNSVIDAAIEALGIISRLLPWNPYERLLRLYLASLQSKFLYQKQLTRIVMTILDSFHFDLSKASTLDIPNALKSKSSDLIDDKSNAKPMEEGPQDHTNSEEIVQDLAEQMDEDEEVDADVVVDTSVEKSLPAVERKIILCPSAATRVIQTISTALIPQLHKVLTARSLVERVHKVNKKQAINARRDQVQEEEEVLRVPLALAVVKLFQRLPEKILDRYLPGVLTKLCNFLKSRLESVRRVTRETLQKVMISLGPRYLSTLLNEMTILLTRGFQVHVLIYSLHSVLIALKDFFKAGDIDDSIPYIVEVCKVSLFGYAAEEREEGKVATTVQEAQSTKGYNTLLLTAQFVSEGCLINLLIPFKEIIQTAHSHKIVNKACECLRQIVLGLSQNTTLLPSSLLLFAAGVANENIPSLSMKPKVEKTKKQKETESRRPVDCYIIQEAPKQRVGITSSDAAKVTARMNAHVFVEFGLKIIYFLLKQEKLKELREDFRSVMDPLIPLFNNCLASQHVKLSTISLQCLSWLLKMDLPSLKSHISSITTSIFSLLHKFAAAGLSKGDNFDLVVAAFKAVAVLVRHLKYHTLDEDQLKALLMYAEQDVADTEKHATAFALLKAILSRKLIVPEIHDVMDKVAVLSIASDQPHVRIQARLTFHQYLLDYPLRQKLARHLAFYLSQLSHELQSGRESALEMLNLIISSFPPNILSKESGVFFVTLGTRLVNDDSPECRKMVAQCISKLLSRLHKNERDRLFNISLLWLQDKKVSHRRLAAQLCGLFVLCEKEAFKSHLPELLPAVIAQFASKSMEDENCDTEKQVTESERMRDHNLYQVLQLVLKICSHCPSWLSDEEFSSHVYNLTEHAQSSLAHPHEWVRLSAAQILTHILNAIDVDALSRAVLEGSNVIYNGKLCLGFFEENAAQKLKSMILDHCGQMCSRPDVDVGQQLLLQVVKNLIIFADILKSIPEDERSSDEIEDDCEKQSPLTLRWLAKRMRIIANKEVVHNSKSITMRTMVLNWIAAIAVKLGDEYIRPVLSELLAPMVRVLTTDQLAPEGSTMAQLQDLAREVSKLIKKTVGSAIFMQTRLELQNKIGAVRAERKIKRKLEAVAEPEIAAKRKLLKKSKQKEAKKNQKNKVGTKKNRNKKKKRKRETPSDDF